MNFKIEFVHRQYFFLRKAIKENLLTFLVDLVKAKSWLFQGEGKAGLKWLARREAEWRSSPAAIGRENLWLPGPVVEDGGGKGKEAAGRK